MNIKMITISLLITGFAFVTTSAEATPAFARKYKTNCSACHTAWPQLNRAGRKFKEAGYRFPKLKGETTTSDFLHMDTYFPVSALMKARPYDKANSGNSKVRALHEVELLFGGVIYKNVSGFFEIEAEDENTNERGFKLGIPHAVVTYNHSKAINAQFAYAGIGPDDPYDSYGHRRLTRSAVAINGQTFGGADNGDTLASSRQSVGMYGRPIKNLYYSVAIAGVGGDSEGEEAGTLYGRVAFDITSQITIGARIIDGTCKASATNCAVSRDYSRTSVDAQADINNFRFMGAFLKAKDDNAGATSEVENDAWYLQGQYVVKDKGRPTWVPLIRFDQYEKNNGVDEYKEFALNLGYYFTQNIKGFIEWWERFDTPTGVAEDDRITFQLEAAF